MRAHRGDDTRTHASARAHALSSAPPMAGAADAVEGGDALPRNLALDHPRGAAQAFAPLRCGSVLSAPGRAQTNTHRHTPASARRHAGSMVAQRQRIRPVHDCMTGCHAFAGDEAQRAARSTCTTQACTSCNSVHDCAIARRCMSLRDCTPALLRTAAGQPDGQGPRAVPLLDAERARARCCGCALS